MANSILKAAAGTALLAALSTGASAQVTHFGAGCAGGSGLTPTIDINGFAEVTANFSVDIATGIPGTLSILIIGGSNTSWLGSPLPLDLGFAGLTGCNLNVSYDNTLTFLADANGDISLPVSGAGFTPGTTVYAQAFAFDPGPGTLGGMTDGMEVIIGPGQVGPLVISEFLKDPGFTSESTGEWVEIFNPTGADIDIEGYTLSDLDFDSTILDNGGLGVIVPAGGYLVIGNEDDQLLNGNVPVGYQYGVNGQFFLSNSGDEIVLTDLAGGVVDRVIYDNGVVWPDSSGKSIAVDAGSLDINGNDDGVNWAHATCTIAGGPVCNPDLGTPGYANSACTTTTCGGGGGPSGELIITEIMQNPSAVGDNEGEWFEVYNTTAGPIDKIGYT
ncbi:MAG: lamin tail domain-containing protein, partial [Planctomycetota bacterium]|nr:lamin tail domain-containing protein [Planctomycetota bacterium]